MMAASFTLSFEMLSKAAVGRQSDTPMMAVLLIAVNCC